MEGRPTPEEELRDAVRLMRVLLAGNRELGLDPPAVSAPVLESLERKPPAANGLSGEAGGARTLDELRAILGDCRRCPLHTGRNRLVFGEGNLRADLLFVGEGPGGDEDRTGRPFVGEAGRLLTRIINAMGLSRSDVYICNVVKCRPPRNRNPEGLEIAACRPFLERQIDLVKPKVICTLGRVAGEELLGKTFSVTRDRGAWFEYRGVPVMPTFHPAYLLRNPAAKRNVWEDVQKIMKRLAQGGGNHG
ncbi:MAG: uracil-DNA glycosylase [Thermodesulfobacteriota bacterium]